MRESTHRSKPVLESAFSGYLSRLKSSAYQKDRKSMGNHLVPWWGKIGAKIVLSRLPFGYGLWQRLGLFRHGDMDTASYALSVFDTHVERAGLRGALAGRTIVELGPGDGLATAVIAASYGARAILVDTGDYANKDLTSATSRSARRCASGELKHPISPGVPRSRIFWLDVRPATSRTGSRASARCNRESRI